MNIRIFDLIEKANIAQLQTALLFLVNEYSKLTKEFKTDKYRCTGQWGPGSSEERETIVPVVTHIKLIEATEYLLRVLEK
jgi:hypothetical protein